MSGSAGESQGFLHDEKTNLEKYRAEGKEGALKNIYGEVHWCLVSSPPVLILALCDYQCDMASLRTFFPL